MRDVVTGFYLNVLRRLLDAGAISTTDSVLVVCGGPLDEAVTAKVGFQNVIVTNLDNEMSNTFQDAENLTYENGSFDVVIVHAGLHHCNSPCIASFPEMYRVARKCVVVFEAREDAMRIAVRAGLTGRDNARNRERGDHQRCHVPRLRPGDPRQKNLLLAPCPYFYG